mgnify:CR=1 FL=1
MNHTVFIEAVIIIIPVLLAGLTFIFVLKKGWLSSLKKPIDRGILWKNKPILGKNKTWLGFLAMSIGAAFYETIIMGFSQLSFSRTAKAALLGLAYSLGELPNSFIKRRYGIAEGKTANASLAKIFFRILDTVDSVIAVSIAARFLYGISFETMIAIILIGSFIHLSTDTLMVFLKLKK